MIGSYPEYYCNILFQKIGIVDTVLDYKNSAELPCKDKKIILRNPRNYKLE